MGFESLRSWRQVRDILQVQTGFDHGLALVGLLHSVHWAAYVVVHTLERGLYQSPPNCAEGQGKGPMCFVEQQMKIWKETW